MKRWRAGWCLAGLLLGRLAVAADNPPLPGKDKPSDDDLQIKGVFNSVLPRTERKNALRLIVHPHLGDLTKRDHLRTALGFRYGITSRWEATLEADAYFAHGLKGKEFFADSGFSTVHVGTKYRLGDPFGLGWDTSIGLNWQQPAGSPPMDVTDGLKHTAPFLTTSHNLADAPGWRVFAGFGGDAVTATATPGALQKNELGEDSVNVTGGALYERGTVTYAFEATVATTRFTAPVNRDVYTVRPSVVWVLPEKYKFGAKGKWLLGIGLRLAHGPDGNDVGLNAKLRVNFDVKRLLGRKKEAASAP